MREAEKDEGTHASIHECVPVQRKLRSKMRAKAENNPRMTIGGAGAMQTPEYLAIHTYTNTNINTNAHAHTYINRVRRSIYGPMHACNPAHLSHRSRRDPSAR